MPKKIMTPEDFAALKESILEKLKERLSVAITEYVEGLEVSLEQQITDQLRDFWKKSEPENGAA